MYELFTDCAHFIPEDRVKTRAFRAILSGRAAFLMIDVQKDYFDPGNLIENNASYDIQIRFPAVARKIRRFYQRIRTIKSEIPHIWMVHTFKQAQKLLALGGQDALRGQITFNIADNETIIAKPEYSSFYETELAAHLKERGIDTLFVCGGILEDCISATMRGALKREGINIILVADLIAARDLSNALSIKRFFNDPSLQKIDSEIPTWAGVINSRTLGSMIKRSTQILRHTKPKYTTKQPLTAAPLVHSV